MCKLILFNALLWRISCWWGWSNWLQIFSNWKKYFLSLSIQNILSRWIFFSGGRLYMQMLKNPMQFGYKHWLPQNLVMFSTVWAKVNVSGVFWVRVSEQIYPLAWWNKFVSMNSALLFIPEMVKSSENSDFSGWWVKGFHIILRILEM